MRLLPYGTLRSRFSRNDKKRAERAGNLTLWVFEPAIIDGWEKMAERAGNLTQWVFEPAILEFFRINEKAERAGFEPAIPCGILALQASCEFKRSLK